MAPGYRANNQSRRANRSYVDHDVFEGLPVRNWRRDTVTIAPPPIHEISTQKDKWDIELPWGMPKDSHLLPQHSQDLLRAARSGKLYVRRPQIEEEEVDTEAVLGDKPDKKEEDPKEKGFSVKTWKLVPKHQESPEIEFLAKRRKGLTGTAVKTALISAPTMTKARVRRTDAAGKIYLEDVFVAEGQSLEGELISQTVITDLVVNKTAADAIPPLLTPPRRRPPPPKRKAKGPGRGRKRKLPLIATSVPGEPGGVKPEMENEGTGIQNDNVVSGGVKREGSDTANNENENEDTEIGDEAINPSDEEVDDGSDEDDQSEGEAQGDPDEYDVENTDPKHPGLVRTETNESVDTAHGHSTGQDREMDASPSPELPLAIMGSTVGYEHGTAGSPLRNVVTLAPTLEEHSPDLISDSEAEAEGDDDEVVHDVLHPGLRVEVETSDMQDTYHIPRDQSFHAEHRGDGMATEQNQDYMEDDQMLLDGDISSLDFGTMPSELEQYPEPYLDDDEIMPVLVQERQEHFPQADPQNLEQEPHFFTQDIIADPSRLGSSEGAREDEEDNFEDLLGSLEDHLNEQGAIPMAEPLDGDVKMKDEVAYVPATDQIEAAAQTDSVITEGAAYRVQDEVPDKQPATEDSNVDVKIDLEANQGQAEQGEVPAPPAAADE